MRSSAVAGFLQYELNEKVHREAFGKTHISMTIAVVAVFTVPLTSIPDVALSVNVDKFIIAGDEVRNGRSA